MKDFDVTPFRVEDILKSPDRQWIVEGLIPNGLTVLAGHPKMGKSRLALQLAMCLSSGNKFLGRRVYRGESVYFALDDDMQTLKERFQIMDPGQVSCDGIEFILDCPPMDGGGAEVIAKRISVNSAVRLVVIDVWQRIRCQKYSQKQNAYERDYLEASKLKKLAQEQNVAILMVHHLRKSQPGEEASDVFERLSGSMGIIGAADCGLVLERKRLSDVAVLHAAGKAIPDMAMEITCGNGDLNWSLVGDICSHDEPASKADRAVKIMGELGPRTISDLQKALGGTPQAIHKMLTTLVKRNIVEKSGRGVYGLIEVGG